MILTNTPKTQGRFSTGAFSRSVAAANAVETRAFRTCDGDEAMDGVSTWQGGEHQCGTYVETQRAYSPARCARAAAGASVATFKPVRLKFRMGKL